jgi:hypothetical protein
MHTAGLYRVSGLLRVSVELLKHGVVDLRPERALNGHENIRVRTPAGDGSHADLECDGRFATAA